MTFNFMPRVFGGTVVTTRKSAHRHIPGFAEFCYEAWPDLPNGSAVIVIPEDDYLALLEELRGRPYVETRPFWRATLPPRHLVSQPPPPPPVTISPTKRSLIAELLRKARGR